VGTTLIALPDNSGIRKKQKIIFFKIQINLMDDLLFHVCSTTIIMNYPPTGGNQVLTATGKNCRHGTTR